MSVVPCYHRACLWLEHYRTTWTSSLSPVSSSAPTMEVQQGASLVKQLFPCFTIYTLSMSIGAGTGFSGVVNSQVSPGPGHFDAYYILVCTSQLKSEETGFGMSTEEISWFGEANISYLRAAGMNCCDVFFLASLMTFATIPTCLLGGVLGEYLGRRMTCFLVSPLFLTGFLCTALSPVKHFAIKIFPSLNKLKIPG